MESITQYRDYEETRDSLPSQGSRGSPGSSSNDAYSSRSLISDFDYATGLFIARSRALDLDYMNFRRESKGIRVVGRRGRWVARMEEREAPGETRRWFSLNNSSIRRNYGSSLVAAAAVRVIVVVGGGSRKVGFRILDSAGDFITAHEKKAEDAGDALARAGPIGKEKFPTCPFCSVRLSLARFPSRRFFPGVSGADPCLSIFSYPETRLPLLVGANPLNFAPFETERIAGESQKESPIEHATLGAARDRDAIVCMSGRSDTTVRVTRFPATRGFAGNGWDGLWRGMK